MAMKKYAILIGLFFVAAIFIGAFIACNRAYIPEQKTLIKKDETLTLYDSAVLHIKESDFKKASDELENLRTLKDSSHDNIEELYYYTRAELSVQNNDFDAAKKNLANISDSYSGEFSNNISKLKKLLFNRKNNANNPDASKQNASDGVESSQKVLSAKRKNINMKMLNEIAEINGKIEYNEVQNEQGLLPVQTYYKTKTELDLEVVNVRIRAVDEEIQAIKDAKFSTLEEKELEINTAEQKKNLLIGERNNIYITAKELENLVGYKLFDF